MREKNMKNNIKHAIIGCGRIAQNHFNVVKNEKLTKRNRQDRIEILITNYVL